ncbi:MAG: hypothetical protein ACYCWW_19680 [Deltaproteobacteria bacterium]
MAARSATLDPTVGCPRAATGGPCVTAGDCVSGDICRASADGGVCAFAAPPIFACLALGAACGADGGLASCCSSLCQGGHCQPLPSCAVANQGCNGNGDCCNGLACVANAAGSGAARGSPADAGATSSSGSCQPTCGGSGSACTGSGQCCSAQGLSCLPTTPGGTPVVCGTPSGTTSCGDACSGDECVLGSFCQDQATASGTVDPCASAGLVCDPNLQACRQPLEFETCLPGGPACRPLLDSTVSLQCLSDRSNGLTLCVQPCAATADCATPYASCQVGGTDTAGNSYSVCSYNIVPPAGCTDYFGSCPAAGAADGLCVPIFQAGFGSFGLCWQAATDGGALGDPCFVNATRATGGFCAAAGMCLGGVCAASCNAGTDGGPTCGPQTLTDGGVGATQQCDPTQGQSGNAADYGNCSVACDFTSASGGGCVTTPEGTPEKCFPMGFYGLPDSVTGMCLAAAPNPLPVGAVCNASALPADLFDPCIAGALCLGIPGQTSHCDQLCNGVGQPGAPCASGQTCTALSFGGGALPTHTGYCQ